MERRSDRTSVGEVREEKRSEGIVQSRPDLGDWEGPIYGQLGMREHANRRVQCHACGRWFKDRAGHARLLHHLSADEYRAIFGPRVHTALVGTGLGELRRQFAAARLRVYQPLHTHVVTDQTFAERSRR